MSRGIVAAPFDLGTIAPEYAGVIVGGEALHYDSRALAPGQSCAVLATAPTDAVRHTLDALDRGAAHVFVDAELGHHDGFDARVVRLADFGDTIGRLASAWYGDPSADLTVVGITGTNGKTSTVQLLADSWHRLGARAATIGTLGAAIHGQELTLNGFTTPPVTRVHELLAEFRAAGVTHVAMEVSSHALETHRVAGVAFDVVGYSNLTRDHLDFHGSMEHYAAQKAKIFALRGLLGKPAWPLAVANLDDPTVRDLFDSLGDDRPKVGVSSAGAEGATIRAADLRFDRSRTRFRLEIDGVGQASEEVDTGLIGRFNVDNLLQVIAVLRWQRVPLAELAAVIAAVVPVHGRMTRIRPDDSVPTVVVDAGHTPDALRQALAAVGEYDFARVITVFGCTGDRDPGKRPEMAQIAESASDVVIVTDDDVHDEDGDKIVAEILAAMTDPDAAIVERDRTTAVRLAIGMATADDVVLLAGKGHEPMQIVANHVEIPYSDLEVARTVLAELLERAPVGSEPTA